MGEDFMLNRACQQTQEMFVFQKLGKEEKKQKRRRSSSREKQPIQQYSSFRGHILKQGVEKPLSSLDLNDWVKELGIKNLKEYSQEIISQKELEKKNVE